MSSTGEEEEIEFIEVDEEEEWEEERQLEVIDQNHFDEKDELEQGEQAEKDSAVNSDNDLKRNTDQHRVNDQFDEDTSSNDGFIDVEEEEEVHENNHKKKKNDAEDDDFGDDPSFDVIRQDSSFEKLSTNSWMPVDSEYDTEEEIDDFSNSIKFENDDGFGLDTTAQLIAKPIAERSVLECVVSLLTGTGATKKKTFGRFGDRRMWFSTDLTSMNWVSKKKSDPKKKSDVAAIYLQNIIKIKCNGTNLQVSTEKKKMALSFSTPEECSTWLRCLACFVPLQAKIMIKGDVVFNQKERESYEIYLDTFNGQDLRQLPQLNDYTVLGLGNHHNRLVLCRDERKFYGMRYIGTNDISSLLGSPQEIAVYKKLSHPHVLHYKEFLYREDTDGYYAIFDYAPRGIVLDPKKLDNVKALPEDTARTLISNVLTGLSYLHSLRIAHSDIRPENLLLAVDGSVKINPLGAVIYDFSSKKEFGIAGLAMLRSHAYQVAFLAPEQCNTKGAPKMPEENFTMDSWSAIALLYFMLFGRIPFPGSTPSEIQENICNGQADIPEKAGKKLKDLFKKVFVKQPKKRPTVDEILKHSWFADEAGKGKIIGMLFGKNQKVAAGKMSIDAQDIENSVGEANIVFPNSPES